jgi:hypothetical protein
MLLLVGAAAVMLMAFPAHSSASCSDQDTCAYDLYLCDAQAAQDCYGQNCANAEILTEKCYYEPDPADPTSQCYIGYGCSWTCQDAGGCGEPPDECGDGGCHAGNCPENCE